MRRADVEGPVLRGGARLLRRAIATACSRAFPFRPRPMDAQPPLPPIARWHALQFLGVAIALAFVASLALQPWFSPRLLMLISWNVGALCYLGFGWLVIARTDEMIE